LSPDDMQTFTLIPSFGVDKQTFWDEANALAKNNLMDNNLAWMYQLLNYSRLKRLPIRKEYFRQIGADVPLFKGVETWFERLNQYAAKKGIELEHYIISSGLKEIIEGSGIASQFKRIYASSYLYSADGVAEWPAQAINYTTKTQYIFRIAKGFMEEYDERVNDSMPDAQLRIPYENIVYIGDSATDIPCMRLVKSKGGYSVGVFDPSSDKRRKVYQLYTDGRISFYAPADYSARSNLTKYMKQIVDEIAAREAMKREQKTLEIPTNLYKLARGMEQMLEMPPEQVPDRERKKLNSGLDEIKSMIEGNLE
nr:haloacid dehalogenase-like hydrolase [Clostridiales bacterium]